ncbi:DNA-binding transcriptional MocR family regulator [Paraburkholderia silvatlantica]|uniref:DNA-binding transcriptional MocR family regulator n=1 Tax=Paraburkholderia silvatlantica TaxID=321895 RepID=A0ABR6FHC2_9BURK|nr:DNA-binding transcriptional MocR family regulator [Paraburkholderia silvatlantica]PVY37553.1 aminotransferase class I and II [Paraburkholderia silvatlantica]PXW42515.1 aminotransferase class I and II [Paraburkholderia silvatlantica]
MKANDYQTKSNPDIRTKGRQATYLEVSRNLEEQVRSGGAQHGLYAVLSSLMGHEGVILSDKLTYYGLKALAPVFQFELVGIPSDAEGLLPDQLEDACRRMPVKAIFTVPNLQNPSVVTMSLERRLALVEIARRHHIAIIEDDVYGPLLRKRLPTIASLCPELTFHVASTSKVLARTLQDRPRALFGTI